MDTTYYSIRIASVELYSDVKIYRVKNTSGENAPLYMKQAAANALKTAFSKTLFYQWVHASYSYPEKKKNEVGDNFSGELLSFISQTSSQLLQDWTLANRSMCPLVLANTNACNHRVFSHQLLKGEHQL
jgi:hypothetical protein